MEGSARMHPENPADAFDPDALLRRPGARLLVLAPHPDDESLAAAGLIQRARAHGAPVSVVFASDGENNPWPQRAMEHRAWIGARQRAAWGARRHDEADAALRILGVDPARVHRLGWPDGGVTRMLLDGVASMLESLRALIVRERPTVLVLPDMADRHPDHGALRVLVEMALRDMPDSQRPICLGYLLHGHPQAGAAQRTVLALAGAELEGKRRAIAAHASQMVLSRRRFMGFASPTEVFAIHPGDDDAASARLPWLPSRAVRPLLSLLVVDARGAVQLRLDGKPDGLRWRDGSPAASVPREVQAPFHAKLFCRLPSPWVFDGWGWCRVGTVPALT